MTSFRLALFKRSISTLQITCLHGLCSGLCLCHRLELGVQNSNACHTKPAAKEALRPRKDTVSRAFLFFTFLYNLSRKTPCCIVPNIFIFFLFCIEINRGRLESRMSSLKVKKTRLNWQVYTHWRFGLLVDVLVVYRICANLHTLPVIVAHLKKKKLGRSCTL